MATASLCLWLAVLPTTTAKYTLSLFEGYFVVRHGAEVARAPLVMPQPKPPLSVMFRKDRTFAVWDDRGLTVRRGSKVHSSRLPDIAVSPRVFPKKEILETISRIHAGNRTRAAAALSGCRRIGNVAYFLIRWNENDGNPWMEALVEVDMTQSKPEAKYLGRFEGISTARKAIDDALFVTGDHLAVITRRDRDWGVAACSLKDHTFEYHKAGDHLLGWNRQGLFTERSSYGTTIGGSLDVQSLERKNLFEDRGGGKWLDAELPPIAITQALAAAVLRNCESGMEIPLPDTAGLRRIGKNVCVWSPLTEPTSAVLYDPERWVTLARWKKSGS